jgi:WD40 repeat protein
VFCALNGKARIAEVELERFVVTRHLDTAPGPYNLAITPGGDLLVATYKTAGQIGVWDLAKGEELARLPSSRGVTHGVVISPDGRFAFVTAEGKGSEPGALDIVDLRELRKVASVAVGLQAGGIAYAPPRSGQD